MSVDFSMTLNVRVEIIKLVDRTVNQTRDLVWFLELTNLAQFDFKWIPKKGRFDPIHHHSIRNKLDRTEFIFIQKNIDIVLINYTTHAPPGHYQPTHQIIVPLDCLVIIGHEHKILIVVLIMQYFRNTLAFSISQLLKVEKIWDVGVVRFRIIRVSFD